MAAMSTRITTGFRRLRYDDAEPLHLATNAAEGRGITYYVSMIFYRGIPRWQLYAIGERGLRTIATERSLSDAMRHAHITFPLHPGEELYLDPGPYPADFEILRATPQGGDWFAPARPQRDDASLRLNERLLAAPAPALTER